MNEEIAPSVEPVVEPVASEPAVEPVEQVTEAPSRQDAIAKAFDAVDAGEDAAPSALDGDASQPRGPDGKFVAKDGAEIVPDAQDAPAEAIPAEKTDPAANDAPARFSADARAEWAKAPASVQGEIKRAVSELETGLRQKDALIEPLKPYMDMAKQAGADLPAVVKNYVDMEQALYADLPAGLSAIARNMGMTLDQMISKATGSAPATDPRDAQILSLEHTVSQLQNQFGTVQESVQQQSERAMIDEVQRFSQDRPRFDELSDEMARMISTGYAADLADAYDKAVLLNPAPQPAPVAATAPPVQTRAARSVTGAPTSGSNPASRQPSSNRTEAIARSFAAAGLG